MLESSCLNDFYLFSFNFLFLINLSAYSFSSRNYLLIFSLSVLLYLSQYLSLLNFISRYPFYDTDIYVEFID